MLFSLCAAILVEDNGSRMPFYRYEPGDDFIKMLSKGPIKNLQAITLYYKLSQKKPMETDFNKYQGLSHDSKIMITQLSNLLQPNPEQRITMHDLSLVEEFTDLLKLPDRLEEVQSNIARVVLQQRVNDSIHRQAWLKNSQGVKQNSVNSRPGSDTTNISDSSFEEQPTKAFRNPFAASNANSIHSATQFESNNDDDGTSIEEL